MSTATRSFGRLYPTPASLAVDWIGFARNKVDRDHGTLLVRFARSGSTYYYANVPRSIWYLARTIARELGGALLWRTVLPLIEARQVRYAKAHPRRTPTKRTTPQGAKSRPTTALRALYHCTSSDKVRAYARPLIIHNR